MSFSGRVTSKVYRASVRLVVIFVLVSIAISLSPVQAEVAGVYARRALRSVFEPSGDRNNPPSRAQDFVATQMEDPSANADRVTHFRLCPRRVVLYVGEAYTLAPVPMDRNTQIVSGVAPRWSVNDPNVATVTSWGEVNAIVPGHTVVTVQAGTGRATVAVEVREGARRRQSDLEFDLEHSGDCSDPFANGSNGAQAGANQHSNTSQDESSERETTISHDASATRSLSTRPSNDNGEVELEPETANARSVSRSAGSDSLAKRVRPGVLRSASAVAREFAPASSRGSSVRVAARTVAATKKIFGRGFFYISDPIDGSSGDAFSPAATAPYNAVGNPRFAPEEGSQVGAAKTKNQLGSYNFLFRRSGA